MFDLTLKLRFAVLAVVLLSGCYVGVKIGLDGNDLTNPDSGSPDAAMTADSGPAPADSGMERPDSGMMSDDGDSGTSDGGMTTDDGGETGNDAGMPPPHDGGMTHDGGTPPKDGGMAPQDGGTSPKDGGMPPPHDGGMNDQDAGAPGIDDCFEVDICSAYCPTPACKQRCLAMGTAAAQTNFTDLQDCLNTNCAPGDGGVCDDNATDYDGGACSACQSDVTSPNHPCFALAITCYPTQCAQNSMCSPPAPFCDTPQDFCVQCLANSDCPSGEACIGTVCQAADLACVGIYYCNSGCATTTCTSDCIGGGTQEARTVYGNFSNCLNAACPITNGAVCDTTASNYNSASCQSCIDTAQNGTCNQQLIACIENCSTSGDCTFNPATPACDTATSTCVECASSSDCPGGWICASNVCIETCSSPMDCPQGETCSSGICVSGH